MLEFTPGMIMWSADRMSKRDIRRVVDASVLPHGTIIELGRVFLDWHSKNIIRYCEERGYPVFCNAQIYGTADQCLAMTQMYLQYRPTILSIVASTCNTGEMSATEVADVDILKRFAEACAGAEVQSCALTMAPKSWSLAKWEFRDHASSQAMRYVDLAYRAGIQNILTSTSTIARICKDSIYRSLCLNAANVVSLASPEMPRCCDVIRNAIECGANRVMVGAAMTIGDGPIEKRVQRNYSTIRGNLMTAISRVNALP